MKKLAFALDALLRNSALSLSLDSKTAVLIVSSTLLLTVEYYRNLTPWQAVDLALICLAAPLLLIVVWWGQPPSAYGLRVGNWRRGLLFTLGRRRVRGVHIRSRGTIDSGEKKYGYQ